MWRIFCTILRAHAYSPELRATRKISKLNRKRHYHYCMSCGKRQYID